MNQITMLAFEAVVVATVLAPQHLFIGGSDFEKAVIKILSAIFFGVLGLMCHSLLAP